MKKKIYQWHRKLSIIIAIPVLLWAASGFMHPLMTNIRPAVSTQALSVAPIDSSRIRVTLQKALLQNHLDHFAAFRLIHIDTNWFYQVQLAGNPAASGNPATSDAAPVYLSCTNGKALPAGDWLYAQYIARQFLEGPPVYQQRSIAIQASFPTHEMHDCCGAATDCVLNPVKGAKVANVSRLTDFDREYKSINRLLPAYRVSFDRPDGIRIYVETTTDRFAFAMDNRRAIFDEIFRLLHTWGWLDFLGKGKLAVEMTLALLAFCTTLMGICIFFMTKSKKASAGNELVKARRTHRYVSIIASLFTLLWTFSGSYHAFSKFTDDTRDKYFVRNRFASDSANFDLGRLQAGVQQPIVNIGLVSMQGRSYWQVYTQGHIQEKGTVHKDLMKDGKAPMTPVDYLSTADYSRLPDGDARYADWLSTCFSRQPADAIRSTTPVTAFGDEYNFTDKRLPVWKVGYAIHDHERYYVETSTGKLSVRVDDKDLAEGYSFSVFHKHHFMDWGGKSVRDISTMFWAFVQVAMVTFGLLLYFKYRRRTAGH